MTVVVGAEFVVTLDDVCHGLALANDHERETEDDKV